MKRFSRSELEKIEPFLSVRHYYVLLINLGEVVISRSRIRSVIGHDYNRVLGGARKALNAIKNGGCPQLRPYGVWSNNIEEKASITTSFGRLLVNHGLDHNDLPLLKENHLSEYARYRLLGMTQYNACASSKNIKKVSLDDEVIHKLQIRKYPNFKQPRIISKRWTRGAVRAYSKMVTRWGGCVINKAGMDKSSISKSSKARIGNSASVTLRNMAVLSHRVLRLFTKSVVSRELLELSELSPDEYEKVIDTISIVDWRVVGNSIRCYWKCDLAKFVRTNRTELVDGIIHSSVDIPMSDV